MIQLVAGYFGQRVRRAVHGFMIAGLMIVILLPVMKMVFTIPGAALLVAATFVGVACAIAYLYFPSVGTFFTILSPAPINISCSFRVQLTRLKGGVS